MSKSYTDPPDDPTGLSEIAIVNRIDEFSFDDYFGSGGVQMDSQAGFFFKFSASSKSDIYI